MALVSSSFCWEKIRVSSLGCTGSCCRLLFFAGFCVMGSVALGAAAFIDNLGHVCIRKFWSYREFCELIQAGLSSDYAETTMNELLGWYGYGKAVGSKDTDQLDLKRFASTESNAEERHSNKTPPESHQREKASSPVEMKEESRDEQLPAATPDSCNCCPTDESARGRADDDLDDMDDDDELLREDEQRAAFDCKPRRFPPLFVHFHRKGDPRISLVVLDPDQMGRG
ncbi:hypothetical protein CAPTEDRAFT_208460 [Capitella teleta]|uniref:Uncharacterized protein n=1 Tax=Capitella teleta TaxID=283909 RepID=R7V2F6_CAPTE|nr:hypothetical protein CAPTEDRAFT_208460 [Capitella teleta]|eukprot:ELU12689.1 hypothetical protein CAPTEDRAFT_208460 [Capitella teleta]